MKQLQDLMREILWDGGDEMDRTGVGTRSILGAKVQFDLADGFPAVTTKRLAFRAVVGELLWFIRGGTNVNDLREITHGKGSDKKTIWDDNYENQAKALGYDHGYMGPIYSNGWTRWYTPNDDTMVEVPVRTDDHSNYVHNVPDLLPSIDCDLNTPDLWAIECLGGLSGNTQYRVQFKSGFITTVLRPNWKRGQVRDGSIKTVHGVGFIGNIVPYTPKAYNLWYNMMSRCYNPLHPNYHQYGGIGISVSPIWHSYEMFAKTINYVDGYEYWLKESDYEIDKDYYGSKVYSPSTCIFLDRQYNVMLGTTSECIEVDGTLYHCARHATQKLFGNTHSYASEQWRKGKKYRGTVGKYVPIQSRPGYNWRYRRVVNQLADVVDQIKLNPSSRRLIVSAWNAPWIDDMALPPCHVLFRFSVKGGRLNLTWYQRSCDIFLGEPFNIASYAILLTLIANITGYAPGILTGLLDDVHLYSNHFEQAEEMINRQPKNLPELVIHKDYASLSDIENLTVDDFELVGYDPHPAIKAPMAV